ncbi:hypothetical protein SSX86_024613 [Deinandra increscens subsp. villosa]|uniref:Uncharacterized protein n=1 Tax=Deinandra increscens subsp. villosa TaxID=3103831 RepID=A0AAP0CAZ3_9ASTR
MHTRVVVYGTKYYFGGDIQQIPAGTAPYSNKVAQFLVGTSVPDYILNLPNEVINTPMGALITGAPQEKPVANPLGDARNKVQEDIGKEFVAIMESGTMHAIEGASLVTKKVMQKYGHMKLKAETGFAFSC